MKSKIAGGPSAESLSIKREREDCFKGQRKLSKESLGWRLPVSMLGNIWYIWSHFHGTAVCLSLYHTSSP